MGLSVESGIVNTAGIITIFGAANSINSNKFSEFGTNVVPLFGDSTTPPGQCGPNDDDPDDSCKRDYKRLTKLRQDIENASKTSNIPSVRFINQYNKMVEIYNMQAEAHNDVCPQKLPLLTPMTGGPQK